MVLDEGANWKGAGTALHHRRAGREVILVTPAAAVMAEMARTNADVQLRSACGPRRPRLMTDSAIPNGTAMRATVIAFGGGEERVAAEVAGPVLHQRRRHDAGRRAG